MNLRTIASMQLRGGAFAALFALFVSPAVSQTLPVALAPSFASTADEDLPVMSRPRPEYDAKGVPMGGFRLFPTLTLSGASDDNIYRTQNNTVSDLIVGITPAFRLQSQWNQHMLELYGGLNSLQYTDHSTESLTDWNAGADGRYDITGGSSLYANGSAAQLHEPRSSPNVTGFQAAPNRYFLYHGESNVTVQPNRLGITGGGLIDSYRYQTTPLIGGGLLRNGDRDYNEYQGYAKAFYDFSPGYSGFVRGVYDLRQFDQFRDRSGLHRSSNGYRIDAGVDLQLSHLVSGEIYVGYLDQNFSAPLKSISGLDYALQLDWLASPLLTVHLTGQRLLSQVILAGASVSDDKSVGLSADYELLRNVLIQAHINYIDSQYVGITRHDDSPNIGGSLTYLLNNYASLSLSDNYTARATNVVGAKFQDNVISLGLNLHL